MDALDALWADHHNEGLMFSSTVNEAHVLQVLKQLDACDRIDAQVRTITRQWICCNRAANVFESNHYTAWVEKVYVNIERVLDSAKPEKTDSSSPTPAALSASREPPPRH